jgi:hypothetical protein
MEGQSKRYLLRTSERFEVDVTVDATGKYYSNLRTKAPVDSTKSQYDRAMLEVDIWLEDTFGGFPNKLTCLKESPPAPAATTVSGGVGGYDLSLVRIAVPAGGKARREHIAKSQRNFLRWVEES